MTSTPIPESIDRYAIEELLGAGAMGSVYLAYDTRLCRRVAVKVLRSSVAELGMNAVAVALREARAAGAINHPNAAAVYDADERDGRAFIVMEPVIGTPLRRFVGDGSVPLAQRLRWLVDVAGALSAAHAVGVVHRDVKPENVVVREDGVVKVLDFGLARQSAGDEVQGGALAGAGSWVQDGGFVGTPGYIAPELLRGQPVDGRADQFAWGVMAYELLAGSLPWRRNATPFGAIAAVLTEEADPLGADVPKVVAAVVARALAKAPEDRFPSMAALASQIAPFAEQGPESFRPTPDVPRAASLAGQRGVSPLADSIPPPSAPPASRPAPSAGAPTPRPRRALPSRPEEPTPRPRFGPPSQPEDPTPRPRRAPPSRPDDPRSSRRGALPFSPDDPPRSRSGSAPDGPTPPDLLPAFRRPRFDAPIDLAEHLRLLPPGATSKGMFFLDLLAQVGKFAGPREMAAAAGIAERRYVAFLSYPMADLLKLRVAVAHTLYPRQPLGEALRRLGQRALAVVLDTQLGRTILGGSGHSLETTIERGTRAYRLLVGFGRLEVKQISATEYHFHAVDLPLFLETHQVGVIEGVLAHAGAPAGLWIDLRSLSEAVFVVRLR